MANLLAQLEALSQNLPTEENARHALYLAAQKIAASLEAPRETMNRIIATPLQLTIAVIASDMKIFEHLNQNSAASVAELAKAANADELLTKRIMQCLASLHMVDESSAGIFAANNVSKTLSQPGYAAGLYHNFYAVSPAWLELPKHLKRTGYRNPNNAYDAAFHAAFNTNLLAYEYLFTRPEMRDNAMKYMGSWYSGKPSWLDSFSPEVHWRGTTAETLLFVDVGGGIGPQTVGLKQRFPDVPGRMVVQDLPPTVAQGIPAPGVEHIAHEFWTPQPLKGARIYYLRQVLHDYPDEKCVEILQNIMMAMNENSVILLDEMVLPTEKVKYEQAQFDFTMMACLGAMERDELQWEELVTKAGLKIVKTVKYCEEADETIIELSRE